MAPENRLKRGHQQREANYEGSAKEEEVSRVLSGFSLMLRPRKNSNFFVTNRRLILASVFNSTDFMSNRLECLIQSWCNGKTSYLTYFVLPRKFSNDGERQAQVSTFFSLQLIIAGFTLYF